MAATTSIKSPSSILAAIRMLTSSSTAGTHPNPTRNFEDILLGRIKEFQSSFESLSVKFDFENQEIHNFDCQNFFKEKIDVFSAKQSEGAGIQDHEKSTIRWMFIEICLFLVKELKKILQEISNEAKYLENTTETQKCQQNPKLNPDALSVNDQKTVLTCVQFIVCLGIYPNLLPGVGIPVEKRSGYFELIKGSGNELQNERHLYLCLSTLLDCIKHPSLGTLMLSRHLGDILTGLIQVCYAPQSSYYHGNGMGGNQMSESVDQKDDYKEDEEISDGSDKESKKELKNFQKNPENVKKCHDKMFILSSERENCAHELQRLLNRVYQPLIIKELLMIQSGMNRKSGRKDGRKQVQKSECRDASNGNVGTNSATPQWFVDVCGELLSARLIKPNGVQAVLRAVFETSGGSHSAQDWRKCDMVAMVIASCPSQANSTQEYYEHISPQVLQLLRVKNNELGKQFVRVTSSTVKAMLKHNSSLAKKYILDVMMSPLLRTTEYSECQPGSVVCCEEALTQSIEDIYKVFVVGSDPQSTFLLSLCAVIHPIFELFCFTRKGISHLRSSCQELLVRYLKHIDSSLALKTLYILAYRQLPPKNFGEATTEKPGSSQPPQEVCQRKDNQATKNTSLTISEKSTSEKTSISDSREPIRSHDACCHDNPMPVKLMRCEYSYCHGDSGGILIKSGATWVESFDDVMQRLTGDDVMMHEVRATCLVELLVGMKKDGLSGEFFLHLMKELTRIVSNGDETAVNDEPADLRVYDTQANTHQHSLVILQLVALMCDKLGPSILKDVHHMLAFVKSTLQRGCILCDSDSGLLEGSLVAETLTMAFGMLSAILGGAANVEAKERDSLEELLPLLEKLSLQHPNTEVKEMAHDLRIAIATHGAVWSQQMKEVAEGLGKKKQDNGSKDKSTKSPSDDTKYDEAFAELCDPLIPVRGHAMLTIAKLLHARHPKAMSHTDTLLKIFTDQLSHDDSYIYLAAIQGLVALSSIRTDQVLPHLAREFATCRNGTGMESRDKNSTTNQRSPEVKIKLGEALMKAIRDCGDLIPRYSRHLLSSLLSGVRDPDEFVRASSLSNIGEVSKLLRFSIGPIIHEIFGCLSSVLNTDKSEQVRRAAVLVVTLLLQGLGKDIIQVLSSSLKEIYHLLKIVEACDKDETTRLHAQAALGELDTIMREFLFPKQTFSKMIQVLP